jgi:glc operon protein GlcG
MKQPFAALSSLLLGLAISSIGHAQTIEKKALTLAGAKRIIAAAVAEAQSKNAPGAAIAVVDEGGNLIAVERLDNTFGAGANISIGKARTAALFKRPTKFFEDVIAQGRTAMTTLSDFTPLQGGIPIFIDGQIIGAVGVSGAASAQQDEDLALAGAAGFDAAVKLPPFPVTYLPAKQVNQAFLNGMPLLHGANYKIDAGHRDEAGVVEVHSRDTDILYMLDGTATLITGGVVIDAKNIEPEEIRARESQGGESRMVTKGDVVVIPNGTPHWFKEVNGPINYYVVKVRSTN